MSQSHEKQLIEALRVVCGGEKSEVSPELGDEIVKALREEIAPLVDLAAFPHREYLDEKAASFYCSTPVSTLQRKRVDGKGPVYIKDGAKVLYARKDLDQYMAARKVKTYEQS